MTSTTLPPPTRPSPKPARKTVIPSMFLPHPRTTISSQAKRKSPIPQSSNNSNQSRQATNKALPTPTARPILPLTLQTPTTTTTIPRLPSTQSTTNQALPRPTPIPIPIPALPLQTRTTTTSAPILPSTQTTTASPIPVQIGLKVNQYFGIDEVTK